MIKQIQIEQFQIGQVQWSPEKILESLDEFVRVYEKRPVKDNQGGMMAPHMFATWFMLRNLQPKVIIESGVWKGQGTWLIEQACPESQLHCIDINLKRLVYKSEKAIYYDQDFSTLTWNHKSTEDALLFFDDHMNALERLKTMRKLGFNRAIFEDNYPPGQGDVYSLKQVVMHAGYQPQKRQGAVKFLKGVLRDLIKTRPVTIPPNADDDAYLRENLDIYYEFPPLYRLPATRWGDSWDTIPTAEPILDYRSPHPASILLEEAYGYTWICYVKFK